VALRSLGSADDPLAEEHEALVDVGDRRLLGLQSKAERLNPPGELLKQRLRLLAGSSYEEHQVIGIPDKP
jgi:hypothetical protein